MKDSNVPETTTDRYAKQIVADGPVAYWRMNEQALGDKVIDETGLHHGKIIGSPTLQSAGAILGSNNSSITFIPESFVEIPHAPEFSIPASGRGLTVEVWMRPDELEFSTEPDKTYIHWLGKGAPKQMEWGFRFYAKRDPKLSNQLSAYAWNLQGGLGAGAYYRPDSLEKGQWLHFVACYERYVDPCQQKTGVQLFVNGKKIIGPPSRGTLYFNPGHWTVVPKRGNAPLRIGTRTGKPGSGSFLHGGIDEVAVYPYVLSPEQVLLHYQLGTTM